MQGVIESVRLLAEIEGLLFDLVYCGKMLDGLIDLTQKGTLDGKVTVVFVRTVG